MRLFYSLIMYLLTPCILLRLWWKGRRLPAYRERIAERFCLDNMIKSECDIWIHVVSLGEVIAATPLIDELLHRNRRILVTTMTPTGSMQVRTRFGDKVLHRYVPYDLPDVLQRFFNTYVPAMGVIFETELWPNLVAGATRFRIPLLLANARLSPGSCLHYKKVKFFFKPILNQFVAILAQSAEDAERFKALGADPERVTDFGNIKFDVPTKHVEVEVFRQLKKRWGEERVVVIAASTHDDEELQLLSRLKTLQDRIEGVILLIAPRHPERFQTVFSASRRLGFNTGLRSQRETLTRHNDVVILDSLGELLGFYHISDYAFVGGSLVPVGGHNVLEPIAMGVPVLTGKYMHNFKSIFEDLLQAQAIESIDNADALVEEIIALQAHAQRKKQLIDNASHVLEANKGAVARYADKVESLLT